MTQSEASPPQLGPLPGLTKWVPLVVGLLSVVAFLYGGLRVAISNPITAHVDTSMASLRNELLGLRNDVRGLKGDIAALHASEDNPVAREILNRLALESAVSPSSNLLIQAGEEIVLVLGNNWSSHQFTGAGALNDSLAQASSQDLVLALSYASETVRLFLVLQPDEIGTFIEDRAKASLSGEFAESERPTSIEALVAFAKSLSNQQHHGKT